MSEDVVGRTVDGMGLADPRQVMKMSGEMLQKTSDVTAKWVSKAAESVEKATEAPKHHREHEHAAKK
jgi:hypothetical protein